MNDPRTTAIISAIAALLLAYRIFGATEAPGPTLAMLQYVLLALAVVGLVGSLFRMRR